MNANNKKIYSCITIIWYFSIIYFSFGVIYPFFKLTPQMYSEDILMIILYYSLHLVIALPILYCFFQLKKIIFSLSNNTFFSFKTAHRFRNIGYGIMFINCKIFIDITYHLKILTNNKSILTGDLLKGVIIETLLSVESPIVTLLSTFILGFIFILIAKTIEQATIMKDEIDQTV